MAEKWDKITKELDLLIQRGEELYEAIRFEVEQEHLKPDLIEEMGEEQLELYLLSLPDFTRDYQTWYTEALSLVRQVSSGRSEDFGNYYKYPRARNRLTRENFMIQDYLRGLSWSPANTPRVNAARSAMSAFVQQLSIVRAAKSTLNSSLLDMAMILQADLFDSEVETAKVLKKAGFLRPAGAVCGVVLEKHLKQVCTNRQVTIKKKNPTLADLNDALKDNEVILTPDWRRIQLLIDIRNLCCHDREQEPTLQQLDDLLTGTNRVLKLVY